MKIRISAYSFNLKNFGFFVNFQFFVFFGRYGYYIPLGAIKINIFDRKMIFSKSAYYE